MPPENSWLILIRGLFTKMMTIYPQNLCFSLHMDVRAKWLRSFISVLTCAQAVWGFSTVYHLGCTSSNPLSLFFFHELIKGKAWKESRFLPSNMSGFCHFPHPCSYEWQWTDCWLHNHHPLSQLWNHCCISHTHSIFCYLIHITHTHIHIHIHNYSCMWY